MVRNVFVCGHPVREAAYHRPSQNIHRWGCNAEHRLEIWNGAGEQVRRFNRWVGNSTPCRDCCARRPPVDISTSIHQSPPSDGKVGECNGKILASRTVGWCTPPKPALPCAPDCAPIERPFEVSSTTSAPVALFMAGVPLPGRMAPAGSDPVAFHPACDESSQVSPRGSPTLGAIARRHEGYETA